MPPKTRRKRAELICQDIPFIPWSNWVDNTSPIDRDVFLDMKPGFLYLYEDYGGNGKHRRLEKTFGLRHRSLSVSVPTSFVNGMFFVIPPPVVQNEYTTENVELRLNWKESLLNWITGYMGWLGHNEDSNEKLFQNKMVILLDLERWTNTSLYELSRIFYQFYDLLQRDGTLGDYQGRSIQWIATTEPGIKLIPELHIWTTYLGIDKIRTPEWDECFSCLKEQFPLLIEKDAWIRRFIGPGKPLPKITIFFDNTHVYIDLTGVSKRLQIRLQTTRKREFSWRQFWDEIQIMIYSLYINKEKEDIDPNRIIPWYLFASNQINLILRN